MATLSEKLLEHGIRLQNYAEGNHKITCPRCSHTRKNKHDPCLSVTVKADGAVWDCHNCGWTYGVSDRERDPQFNRAPRKRPAPARPKGTIDEPTAAVSAWFAARGIPEDVVRRHKIGSRSKVWFSTLQAEADAIAFPYFRNGELMNVKFRALTSKAFTQVKGAEKILYGLDDIADAKSAIVVEGECDKLAVELAGFRNVVSVPDGAPAKVKDGVPDPEDRKFEFLANCATELDRLERIVLAVDADANGQALEEELARRLGKERCWRVRWPDGNDAQRKDANEVLKIDGPDVLRECIDAAEPYPIPGLHTIGDFVDDTLALYRDGRKRGHSTGFRSLDELMTIREGEFTAVTGIPGAGKSEFVDALMINLAHQYGWRFALCSFENPPSEHIAKLAEKHAGQPFWDGPTMRMSEGELSKAIDWVADHFYLIRADKEAPTIDWILENAKAAVLRHGIRGLAIDPYNELEHKRPSTMTETEYVSQLLGKVKRFAQTSGVHVWFVAYPAKMPRDGGSIPAPTLYDISGSANWANKADLGIVVHRDPNKDPFATEIYVRKVRFKQVGKIGVVTLRYDRATGRYSENVPQGQTGAARGYKDD